MLDAFSSCSAKSSFLKLKGCVPLPSSSASSPILVQLACNANQQNSQERDRLQAAVNATRPDSEDTASLRQLILLGVCWGVWQRPLKPVELGRGLETPQPHSCSGQLSPVPWLPVPIYYTSTWVESQCRKRSVIIYWRKVWARRAPVCDTPREALEMWFPPSVPESLSLSLLNYRYRLLTKLQKQMAGHTMSWKWKMESKYSNPTLMLQHKIQNGQQQC